MPRRNRTYHSSDVFRYYLNLTDRELAELIVMNTVGLMLAFTGAGRTRIPGMSDIHQVVGNKMVLLYSGAFVETITEAISSGFITLTNLTDSELRTTLRGLSQRARSGLFKVLDDNPF